MDFGELFYKDPYRREFDARVISCARADDGGEAGREGKGEGREKGRGKGAGNGADTPGGGLWRVVLEDTAFYPEGGGESADTGLLGGVRVRDVQREGDEVAHYTEGPLETGSTAHGVIDWERRFALMQNHSGEHIVSGLIHKRYGYDNVGFHMSIQGCEPPESIRNGRTGGTDRNGVTGGTDGNSVNGGICGSSGTDGNSGRREFRGTGEFRKSGGFGENCEICEECEDNGPYGPRGEADEGGRAWRLQRGVVTIDVNGRLDWEQALEIESQANLVVWRNLEVACLFPGEERAEEMDFRSKKELEGRVRLVEIPGADLCACCGMHVRRTGEIGIIKLLGMINYKGGVRIEMACGQWALSDYAEKLEDNRRIQRLLCVKGFETADAVEKVMAGSKKKDELVAAANHRYFEAVASSMTEGELFITFEEGLDPIGARKFCELIKQGGKRRICAVLVPKEEPEGEKEGRTAGYSYVIGSREVDLKAAAAKLNRELSGRGGGSREMIQGSFSAGREEIENALRRLARLENQ